MNPLATIDDLPDVPAAKLATKHRQYNTYAPTGWPWLEAIPDTWTMRPLRRIGWFRAGAGFPDAEQGVRDAEIPFFKVATLADNSLGVFIGEAEHTVTRETARRLGATVFPANSIVFAKVGAALLLNRRKLLGSPACLDNNMMAFVATRGDVRFIYYHLIDLDFGRLANPGAVPSLNAGDIRDIVIAWPSLDEQRAVAVFLDRETARIDALIAKKQRLIELLQEKRTALISHAVTKGLDPNAPMKPSGIDWLPDVPFHWRVRPLKFFSNLHARSFTDGDWIETPYVTYDGIRLIQCGNVGTGVYVEQGYRCISEETFLELRCTAVRPGDVLVCRMRSSPRILAGRACQAPSLGERMVTAVDNCIVKCASDVDGRFLVYQLSTREYLEYIEAIARGGTRDRISRSMLGAIRLISPPLEEQRSIADHLDQQCSQISALTSRMESAIERLREYRSALISAAVTGKIDVREESAHA